MDLLLWLDGLDVYVFTFFVFESRFLDIASILNTICWSLWTPTKRTKKNQYQIYQSDFWHWFETRLFVSMISSCSPQKKHWQRWTKPILTHCTCCFNKVGVSQRPQLDIFQHSPDSKSMHMFVLVSKSFSRPMWCWKIASCFHNRHY